MDKMRTDAEKRGRDLGKAQQKYFRNLSSKLGKEIATAKAMILAKADQLGSRFLKRPAGVSFKQERARRAQASGRYARAWKADKLEYPSSGMRISIVNMTKIATVNQSRNNTISRAVARILPQLQKKLQRIADRLNF